MTVIEDITAFLAKAEPSLQRIQDGRVFQIAYQDFKDYLLYKNIDLSKIESEEVEVWVKIWLCKWRQRTKLIFNEADQKRLMMPLEKLEATKELPTLTPEETEGLLELAKFTLLNKGELCGIEIIAKERVNVATKEYFESRKIQTLEEKNRVLALNEISLRLTRDCRMLSKTTIPLILIRIEKSYYRQ
jgi:hypothetical protein